MDFKEFLGAFFAAIKNEDRGFVKKVYGEWFDSAGFPMDQKEQFFSGIFSDLKQISAGTPERSECFDDFCTVRMKDTDSSEYSLTFMKSGGSWIFFNERTNFSLFKKVYALGYVVDGEERLGILFNGKRSPVLTEIGSSGFVSLINAAVNPGDNEITILPGKNPARVTLRISSAKSEDVINSAQGDVLSWEGTVKEPLKLKFRAD